MSAFTKKPQMPVLLMISSVFLILAGCNVESHRRFDSNVWKESNARVRGSMIADLKDRQLLTGKTKEELENLLGEPDYRDANWMAYKVNTISRCYIWECRIEITFDP